MKKITKILLPIASTAAVVAPMVCMTSCSMLEKTTVEADWKAEAAGTVLTVYFPAKDTDYFWESQSLDELGVKYSPHLIDIGFELSSCSFTFIPEDKGETPGKLEVELTASSDWSKFSFEDGDFITLKPTFFVDVEGTPKTVNLKIINKVSQ